MTLDEIFAKLDAAHAKGWEWWLSRGSHGYDCRIHRLSGRPQRFACPPARMITRTGKTLVEAVTKTLAAATDHRE